MPFENKSLGQILLPLHKDENDIALFLQIKSGNRLALNTLFLSYYEPLCDFASRYSISSADAEEIVADVFIRLWKNAAFIEIRLSVRAYLFTSVRYGVLAVKKAQSPFISVDLIADVEEDVTEDHVPERMGAVYQAVDQLPPRCKEVFVMCRLDGLKQAEAAVILGIAEKTVENQLVKAMNLLRARLRPDPERNVSKFSVTKV